MKLWTRSQGFKFNLCWWCPFVVGFVVGLVHHSLILSYGSRSLATWRIIVLLANNWCFWIVFISTLIIGDAVELSQFCTSERHNTFHVHSEILKSELMCLVCVAVKEPPDCLPLLVTCLVFLEKKRVQEFSHVLQEVTLFHFIKAKESHFNTAFVFWFFNVLVCLLD